MRLKSQIFPHISSKYCSRILEERDEVSRDGSFREKVRFDLIDRPHYAFGLLATADMARFCGIETVVAIEFGVASGSGLLNICNISEEVTNETGIKFEIYGFDTGSGLPAVKDYRDHPEVWSKGDFCMQDREQLINSLPNNASVIFGDIEATIQPFIEKISEKTPVGFVALDVDIYSSTVSALKLFDANPKCFLPVVLTYCDDTLGGIRRIPSMFRNAWAGQLLAINEFNVEHNVRKIDKIRTLPYRRPLFMEQWIEKIYGTHILDHPFRNISSSRSSLSMEEHGNIDQFEWPL